MQQRNQRATRFLKKMTQKHPEQSVLWVTHGGIIMPLLMRLLYLSEEKDQWKAVLVPNTAVTILDMDVKGYFDLHRVNCVEHL